MASQRTAAGVASVPRPMSSLATPSVALGRVRELYRAVHPVQRLLLHETEQGEAWRDAYNLATISAFEPGSTGGTQSHYQRMLSSLAVLRPTPSLSSSACRQDGVLIGGHKGGDRARESAMQLLLGDSSSRLRSHGDASARTGDHNGRTDPGRAFEAIATPRFLDCCRRLGEGLAAARVAVGRRLAEDSPAGYGACYPHIVRLHLLRDMELAARSLVEPSA